MLRDNPSPASRHCKNAVVCCLKNPILWHFCGNSSGNRRLGTKTGNLFLFLMQQCSSSVHLHAPCALGVARLLTLVTKRCMRSTLAQAMMAERLMFISELQCTVLEVKVIEGLGTTVDVVLVNGVLHEGDTIVLCGLNGPIVTTIRSLLTPHPLKVCAGLPGHCPSWVGALGLGGMLAEVICACFGYFDLRNSILWFLA